MNNPHIIHNQDNASRAPGQRSTFGTPRDIVSLLFRRRGIFLIILVTIVAAAFVSARNQTMSYYSEARVLVKRGGGASEGTNPRPQRGYEEEMKTEKQMASTREVASLAADALAQQYRQRAYESPEAVVPEPPTVDDLMGGRGVDVIDDTDVIRLSYRALTRRQAIDGANALSDAYIVYSRDTSYASDAHAFYADEVYAAEKRVEQLKAEITGFKQQHRIADLDALEIELTRQRNSVENALIEVRGKRKAKEQEVRTIVDSRESHPDLLVPLESLNSDPNLIPYTRRLAELKGRLNTLLATYTRDNPQVRAIDRDIASCRVSIQNQIDDIVAAKRNTVLVMRSEEQAYETDIARIDAQFARLPQLEQELGLLEMHLKNAVAQLTSLSSTQAKFGLMEEVGPRVGRVSPMSRAVTATPVGGGMKKKLLVIFAVVLGAGLGFVAAFVSDVLDHSLRFPTDVEEALGVPMLASIREVPGSWNPQRAAEQERVA